MLAKEIAASRDFLGEFVGSLLPESPVRTPHVVFRLASLHDPLRLSERTEPMGVQAFCHTRENPGFFRAICEIGSLCRDCEHGFYPCDYGRACSCDYGSACGPCENESDEVPSLGYFEKKEHRVSDKRTNQKVILVKSSTVHFDRSAEFADCHNHPSL